MGEVSASGSRLLAVLVSLAMVIAGCASETPRPHVQPRTFASVAIVSPYEFVDYISPETKGEKAAQGAGTGAGSLGVGGMVAGALVCGPFLYGLCLAGLGLAGLVVGGTGGLIYGVTGISGKDVETLDRKMHELGAGEDLQTMLADSLRAKLPEQMLAPLEEAEVQALVSVSKIEMRHSDDELYLKVTARFEYTRRSSQEPQGGHREFEGRSVRYPLDHWLSDDQSAMQAAWGECREKIVLEMARLLNEHWVGDKRRANS